MTSAQYKPDDRRKLEEELTYRMTIQEQPVAWPANAAQIERHEVHALSAAVAIRRVLRRAKYNDGRFNVESVTIDKVIR